MTLHQYKPGHFAKILPVDHTEKPKYVGYHRDSIRYLTDPPEQALARNGQGQNPMAWYTPYYNTAQAQMRRDGNLKKYILLELERHVVQIKANKTEYVLVSTQDPNDNNSGGFVRIRKVWVQADWLEPLTREPSYEQEAKNKYAAALKEKWAKKNQ